jgi:hypothetical protein
MIVDIAAAHPKSRISLGSIVLEPSIRVAEMRWMTILSSYLGNTALDW